MKHMEHNQKKKSHLNTVSVHQQLPVQNKGKYELILNWYKISGKKLLDEEVLSELPVDTLLKILGNPIWNNIYHCWAVEVKHMPGLQPYTQHQFDPEKYAYFIEAYHTMQ